MMRAVIGYLRRHHLALVAILIASTGTAWAAVKLPHNSVGKAQIRKNAVVSSEVKNHTLLKKDFKSGQLPTGKRGVAGPRGADGAKGAPGPKGIAGSARAYAWVNAGTSPSIDMDRSKGFDSVSSPHPGDYCLKMAAGLGAAKTVPVVTPVYNSGILESEFAQPSDFSYCPANQVAIITYLFSPPNSIEANPNISFTVAVP